ncbi:hypothetical protein C8R45DRAFT_902017 [Mycena sanguinolenta]|nr:hypothetical protein C8R45DRAFT_902017 [Mycena sanguinolenta]
MTTDIDKTMTITYTFRRRTIGRAASPPTRACYEQIPGLGFDEDDDKDNSLSESESGSGSEDEHSHSEEEDGREGASGRAGVEDGVAHDMEMDVDADALSSPVLAPADSSHPAADSSPLADTDTAPPADAAPNAKGKQRAVDPIPPAPRRPHVKKQRKHRGKRERVYTLRPILTIQRSQGFVWNQDLFVPPYIKDRYVAATSPPTSTPNGFVSTSVSSTNSALTDYDNYEVEVVEIRVQEGEFAGIIP